MGLSPGRAWRESDGVGDAHAPAQGSTGKSAAGVRVQFTVERFPWLAEAQLDAQASWWGYYEVTPDHYPILGRMPGVDTWVNAAGFSGHGVQQAPAIGKVIAEEVLDGRAHSIVIDPLRMERFANASKAREHNIF